MISDYLRVIVESQVIHIATGNNQIVFTHAQICTLCRTDNTLRDNVIGWQVAAAQGGWVVN